MNQSRNLVRWMLWLSILATLTEVLGQPSDADFQAMIARMTIPQKIFIEPNINQAGRLGTLAAQRGVGGAFAIWGSWDCPQWQAAAKAFQDAVANAGGPPILLGMDSIHGAAFIQGATIFPHAIGTAATWNTTLAAAAAVITAKDMRTCGLNWVFGPNSDLGMQPLWGRHYETFGDEPALVGAMGRIQVESFQRTDMATPDFNYNGGGTVPIVGSALKHWIGYSLPNRGQDRQNAVIPDWLMERFMLPSFRSVLNVGPMAVMLNSGAVNGIPGHASVKLVAQLLKQDLDFPGVAMSDWDDVKALQFRHHYVPTFVDAAYTAERAGMDMSMPNDEYAGLLLPLVGGNVSMSRVDESVKRILRLKNFVGLFNRQVPYTYPANVKTVGSDADRAVARQTVEESVTLLKNVDRALPINPSGSPKRILVTGYNSHSICRQCGSWTLEWQGVDNNDDRFRLRSKYRTIREAIREAVPNWPISGFTGVLQDANAGDYAEAIDAARDVDYAIIVLGERPYAEGAYNIGDLYEASTSPPPIIPLTSPFSALPAPQLNFVTAISSVSKKVILVLVQGRPRTFNPILPLVDAILYAYLPGPEAGPAIANLIFGRINPSGKLPFNYPVTSGPISLQYTNPHEVRWPIGFGLSYTTFNYSTITTSPSQLKLTAVEGVGEIVTVSVLVGNNGGVSGQEVVQLYLNEVFDYNNIKGKQWMLRRFVKIPLAAGQVARVSFTLQGADFRYVFPNILPDDGQVEVELRIGTAEMNQTGTFTLSADSKLTYPITLNDNKPDNALVEYITEMPPEDPPPIEVPPTEPPADEPTAEVPIEPIAVSPTSLPPTSGPDEPPAESPEVNRTEPVAPSVPITPTIPAPPPLKSSDSATMAISLSVFTLCLVVQVLW